MSWDLALAAWMALVLTVSVHQSQGIVVNKTFANEIPNVRQRSFVMNDNDASRGVQQIQSAQWVRYATGFVVCHLVTKVKMLARHLYSARRTVDVNVKMDVLQALIALSLKHIATESRVSVSQGVKLTTIARMRRSCVWLGPVRRVDAAGTFNVVLVKSAISVTVDVRMHLDVIARRTAILRMNRAVVHQRSVFRFKMPMVMSLETFALKAV